jgi:hypothetical protein
MKNKKYLLLYGITIALQFIVIASFCQSTNSNFLIGVWEDARGPLYANGQTELANFKDKNVLVWTNQDGSETVCSYLFDSVNRQLLIGKPQKREVTIDTVLYEVKIINPSEIELYPNRMIFYDHSESKWIDQKINFGVHDHFIRRKNN